MSPTIALVECPRCGSLRKHPVGADRYHCADCGMTYHLDWRGGQVRVRQPTAPRPSPSAQWNWLPLKVLLLVVGALLVLAALSFWVAPRR
jgi:DNA-directed RNA polymerase subunit RPC12/RpoP